ncbi:plasmid stabilization protein [Spirochaetia bacterium]|nr:plasmid stabilization protein [Spirochaetia bacterium]
MAKKNKVYTVEISERASEMLVHHARFLATDLRSDVSETAAKRLIGQFEAQAKSLRKQPERFPWLSHSALPEHKYRKLLFEKRYLLLYQIKEDTVYIDAMVDCRQDYEWLL